MQTTDRCPCAKGSWRGWCMKGGRSTSGKLNDTKGTNDGLLNSGRFVCVRLCVWVSKYWANNRKYFRKLPSTTIQLHDRCTCAISCKNSRRFE